MASPRTRIGPNANMDVPGDIGLYNTYLDYHRPTTQLLMTTDHSNGFNSNADKAFNKINEWGGLTTLRVYDDANGAPWRKWSSKDMVDMIERQLGGRPAWYEVSNEPRPGQQELADIADQWYADVIYNGVARGLRVTVPGWASGNYQYNEIGWWRKTLQALVDTSNYRTPEGKRFAIFSAHGYGHALLNTHAAGEDPNIMANPKLIFQRYADLSRGTFVRPSADDVFKNRWQHNWLVFRSWWVIQWIRENLVHDANWDGLNIWETEDFWDDMPNIRNDEQHRFDAAVAWVDGKAQEKVSGIPTLEKYWDEIGKEVGWSGAQVMAAQLDWIERIAPSNYVGFNLFSYTENDNWPERWATRFGIQRSSYYIDLYPVYRAQFNNKPVPEPTPPPTPEPEPEPPEEPEVPVNDQIRVPPLTFDVWANGAGVISPNSGNSVNIRTFPTTVGNTPIGAVHTGGPAMLLQPVNVGVDNSPPDWALIRFGDLEGWIYRPLVDFVPLEYYNGPDPQPPIEYPYIDSTHIWSDIVFEPGDEGAGVPRVAIEPSPEMMQLAEDILDRPEFYLWNPLPGVKLMQIVFLLYNAIAEHNQRGHDEESIDMPNNPE